MCCIGARGAAAWVANTGDSTRYRAMSTSTKSGRVSRMICLNMCCSFRSISCIWGERVPTNEGWAYRSSERMLVPNEGNQLPWAALRFSTYSAVVVQRSPAIWPQKDYMIEYFYVALCVSPSTSPTTSRGVAGYLAFPSSSTEKTCLPARQ